MENCKEFLGFLYDSPLDMLIDLKDFEKLHYPVYGYFGEEDINMFSISWQSVKKLRIGPKGKKRFENLLKPGIKMCITEDSGQTIIRRLNKKEEGILTLVSGGEKRLLFEPLCGAFKLEYTDKLVYFRDDPLITLKELQMAVELGSAQYILQITAFTLPDLIVVLADRGWIDISDEAYEEWTKKRIV
jgi:hypothetical protein